MGIQPRFLQHQHININAYDHIVNISGDLSALRLISGFMTVLCGDGNQVAEIHTGLTNGWSMADMAGNPDRNIRPTIFY